MVNRYLSTFGKMDGLVGKKVEGMRRVLGFWLAAESFGAGGWIVWLFDGFLLACLAVYRVLYSFFEGLTLIL